jgi:hypothetical protein
LARKISDIFKKIYAKIENVVLWTRSVRRRQIAVTHAMGCWKNGMLEYWVGLNATNIILTLGHPSAILCQQKKVLFKSQNLEDKALKPTTKARNFKNAKNILNFLLRVSFVFVFSG